MKYRSAIWAVTGLLVAGFWTLFAFATSHLQHPRSTERMRDIWLLISFTCPIAIFGMHHAVSLYESLAANAVTYAVVGLIVETLRRLIASKEETQPPSPPPREQNADKCSGNGPYAIGIRYGVISKNM
jgi:hypothetical protein